VFVLLSLVAMPLSVVQRVQLGYQEGFNSGLWQSLGSIISLAGTLIAIACKASLAWLVLGFTGGPVLALALNSAHQFLIARPWLAPRLNDFSWATSRSLGRVGAQFLLLQVIGLVGFSTDTFILAQKIGADGVTQYAVIQKLFAVAMAALSIGFYPLWPAYAEAVARKDYEWVRRTFHRSLIACVGFSLLFAGPLILFGKQIILAWVKTPLPISFSALCASGAWLVLYGYGAALAMLMNGTSKLRIQIISGAFFAVASLTTKLLVAHTWGVAGVIWATVATYAIFVVVPEWIATRGILKDHIDEALLEGPVIGD
jgi:O-antigen/teichoic acid export membrane protein